MWLLSLITILVVAIVQSSPRAGDHKSPTEGRVIGGIDTLIEEVPWTVSLVSYGDHFCGGSIINNSTILTAAHCISTLEKENYEVRVGSSYRTKGGVLYKVKEAIPHPDFSAYTVDYDVGLLITESYIEFGRDAQPIALPGSSDPLPVGEDGIVSGYGLISTKGIRPEMLQSTTFPVLEQKVCRAAYKKLTETMFCAGLLEGGRDACTEDSGGPFVVNNVLVGIVSWGDECAKPGKPGVYTSVAYIRSWVDEVLIAYNENS